MHIGPNFHRRTFFLLPEQFGFFGIRETIFREEK
tara:strand:+ start:106 stop:207 length:102 start_codon:yes stop_codon:yes gene_type:complete